MTRLPVATRFALFYGAVFLALGVFLPFWPVWLADRGLSESQVGLLLALGLWVKVATGPLFGHLADRRRNRRGVLILLTVGSALLFAGFPLAEGFLALLVLQVLWSVLFNAQIPIGESHAFSTVRAQGLDYGRVRLWGSITFMLAALTAGELLTGRDPSLIHGLVLFGLVLAVCGALLLPRDRDVDADRDADSHDHWAELKALLRHRPFLLFLVAAGLFQGSHAVYYGFSALHWRAAGLSESAVGWLWAEGVLAEILLFYLSARLIRRVPALGLLCLAGLSGVLRWSLLAWSSDPAVLILAQVLHAGTFGAAHLGAMHYLSETAPARLAATAQSVYSAVSGGIVMGLSMILAGRLYQWGQGDAFWAMAGLCLLGLLFLAAAQSARRPAG